MLCVGQKIDSERKGGRMARMYTCRDESVRGGTVSPTHTYDVSNKGKERVG